MEDLSSLIGGLLALLLLSSFAKVFTVLSIVRVGVGLEGAGMSAIVGAFALLLSLVVMQPQFDAVGGLDGLLRGELRVTDRVLDESFKPFMERNTDQAVLDRVRAFHAGKANDRSASDKRGGDTEVAALPQPEIAVPSASQTGAPILTNSSTRSPTGQATTAQLALAFFVTELREALELGLLLLLPFVVIDLLVVNVLMALGVTAMSPRYVSLPIKLLLFVSVDGWTLIMEKLLGGY
jgi:flagellar biosynthetic protein FliP